MKEKRFIIAILAMLTIFLLSSCQNVYGSLHGGRDNASSSSCKNSFDEQFLVEFQVFKFRDRSNGKGIFDKSVINSYAELCELKEIYETDSQEYLFLNDIVESDLNNKTILLLHFYENSGSIQINIEKLSVNEGCVEIYVKKTIPLIGTCDMCAWNIFIVTDKVELINNFECYVDTQFLSE